MEEQDNIVVEELMSVEGIFGGIARDQLVAQDLIGEMGC